jgi:hypothetical protein
VAEVGASRITALRGDGAVLGRGIGWDFVLQEVIADVPPGKRKPAEVRHGYPCKGGRVAAAPGGFGGEDSGRGQSGGGQPENRAEHRHADAGKSQLRMAESTEAPDRGSLPAMGDVRVRPFASVPRETSWWWMKESGLPLFHVKLDQLE